MPYDSGYERNFLALISALISIGRSPRCAAGEPTLGRVRVEQIFELIKGCEVSIHDLCRVTPPARFNIPFELGIAYALSRLHGHKFITFEAKEYRSDVTLSDLKGIDCKAHGNKPRRVISNVLSELGSTQHAPDIDKVMKIFDHLCQAVPQLKRRHPGSGIFDRPIISALIAAATDRAMRLGVINP